MPTYYEHASWVQENVIPSAIPNGGYIYLETGFTSMKTTGYWELPWEPMVFALVIHTDSNPSLN